MGGVDGGALQWVQWSRCPQPHHALLPLSQFGFHSAGKRVTMDMAGNLMLRPT